jgi:type I restriction enzyme M protein
VPVTVWLLRKPAEQQHRRRKILFINAGHLGTMASRTQRVLAKSDIDAITAAFHSWEPADDEQTPHGLSRAVGIETIRANDYDLSPAVYVPRQSEPQEMATAGELARLTQHLARLRGEASRVDQAVARMLAEYSTEYGETP